MILNGLPWKQTEIHSVIFETAFKYCILNSVNSLNSFELFDYDGYSIPRFLPIVVDIMVT